MSADVIRFMKDGEEKSKQEKTVLDGNAMWIRELSGNKVECTTLEKDKLIHWQMLKKNGVGGSKVRNAHLGNDW